MPKIREQHKTLYAKYSFLTKLIKCALNIAMKLTLSLFLFLFVFWMHFRPPRHCLCLFFSYVGAARKVSPNWSLETMICHSSHCFSIVWGQGNAPLVTSLPSSCYMTPFIERQFFTQITVSSLFLKVSLFYFILKMQTEESHL